MTVAIERIVKAWRQARGERNLGNIAAADNAERVAHSLEAREGLAVWHLDRRRRDWVPPLWRRAASQHAVLVLVDQQQRLVLLGPSAGLQATRTAAVAVENRLARRSEGVAWDTIAALPPAPDSFSGCEATYLTWAEVRLHCTVQREPEVEV